MNLLIEHERKTMKNLKWFFVTSLLVFSQTSWAFTDGPAFAQREKKFVEDVRQWVDEMKQYQEQIRLAKQKLKSVTGMRNIDTVVSELSDLAGGFDRLKSEFTDTEAILDRGFAALDKKTREIFRRREIGNSCKAQKTIEYRKLCEAKIVLEIGNISEQEEMIDKLSKATKKLKKLSEQAKKARDLKESTDINNQISALVGSFQLLNMQWRMKEEQRVRNKQLIEQKNAEIVHKLAAGNH